MPNSLQILVVAGAVTLPAVGELAASQLEVGRAVGVRLRLVAGAVAFGEDVGDPLFSEVDDEPTV